MQSGFEGSDKFMFEFQCHLWDSDIAGQSLIDAVIRTGFAIFVTVELQFAFALVSVLVQILTGTNFRAFSRKTWICAKLCEN